MSEAVIQLLTAYRGLSPEERHEAMVALLRDSGELQDSSFSDDTLSALADERFQELDSDESNDASPEAR